MKIALKVYSTPELTHKENVLPQDNVIND